MISLDPIETINRFISNSKLDRQQHEILKSCIDVIKDSIKNKNIKIKELEAQPSGLKPEPKDIVKVTVEVELEYSISVKAKEKQYNDK
jgi:hypothetical protein